MPTPAASSTFPAGFVWGVATAAHQIEGDNVHSDWWDWEKLPGRVKNGEHSGRACDHWNRMEDDVDLMRELGVRSYRFTLEWARIEPEPGQYDESAIERYRHLLALLEEAGIEPMITLHHFTSPRWWRALGGWEWTGAPAALAGYAKLCFERIAPRCRRWCTINEPMVHLGGGYVMGLTPPQQAHFKHLSAPLLGMLRSHAAAYRMLHATAEAHGREVEVGMAHHVRVFDPQQAWNPVHHFLAGELDRAFNWTILMALETGHVKMKLLGLIWLDEKIPELANTQDYLGINYYSRDLVHIKWKGLIPEPTVSPKPGTLRNDLDWEIYPEGFHRVLASVARRVPGKPIYVTENGIADATDEKRPEFIRSHLRELARAIQDGVDVRGYYHWSLMDNFEWIEGFEPRFGLFRMDYSDHSRHWRVGGRVYAKIIRENAV